LLIDFWATWCGPCVAEMPNLHKVYAAYKPKGLEILSVSLDESREIVRQFRAARFPMPWLHGMDAELKAFESKMASDFGVYGVPRAFLVDQRGTIVALGSDLQGQDLEAALARVLGAPPGSK
jgi:thiol-disulfide isomerase/thioredoxin